MGESPQPHVLTLVAVTVLTVLVVLTAMIAAPWTGPILVTLVPDHGLEVSDLIPVVLAGLGLTVIRRRLAPEGPEDGSLCGTVARLAAVVVAVALAGEGALRLADLDRSPSTVSYGLLAALVLGVGTLAACWLGGGTFLGSSPADVEDPRGVPWRRPLPFVLVVVLGTVIDLLVLPSGTVFGASLLAIALAAGERRRRTLRLVLAILGSVGVVLSVASLTDLVGLDVLMAKDEGGAARGVLFGVVIVTVAVPAGLRTRKESSGSLPP